MSYSAGASQQHVLDTSALSAAMRHEPELVAFLAALRPGDVATAPPAVAEVEYGIARLEAESRRRTLLEAERDRLLGVIGVLDWTAGASHRFGLVKAALERAGTPIDDMDVAIAAVALAHGATLITANLAHFKRVPGLRVCHWRA